MIKTRGLILCALLFVINLASAKTVKEATPGAVDKLAGLESKSTGRLGVFAINTANNQLIAYRAKEAFPFCSTSKAMTVAAILAKSVNESGLLNQQVQYSAKELSAAGYAPITQQHLAKGMTVAELCAAAIDYSDNLAMNLLIQKLGGVAAVTKFARSIGDNNFRLDRMEPMLNTAYPNDLRDTTTPMAMVTSLNKLVLGNALPLKQREQLQIWLKANTTGNARIRKYLAKDWLVGDKTGTGGYGTTNDVGIIWPSKCPPIVIAIYFTQTKKNAKPQDEVIALASKIAVDELAKTNQCKF